MPEEVAKETQPGTLVGCFVQGMESEEQVALLAVGAGAGAHGLEEALVAEGFDAGPEPQPLVVQHPDAVGRSARPEVPVAAALGFVPSGDGLCGPPEALAELTALPALTTRAGLSCGTRTAASRPGPAPFG
ncbi:hypothetical protein GXW82_22150 [Streptacidiphilus sp. 4-A2]|nr:hypothetical protein [Streptacidiphilus sp. 4-A2]